MINFGPWDTFHDKICRNFSFWFTNILLSKQELPVQICHINGIQVNHVNVS